VTGREKHIYNTWLAVVRSNNNKPFKLRKNWTAFEEKPEYYQIKKLANFFNRHDNIDINDFFTSPFKVYPEPANYDLQFYNTMKALTCYKIYINKKLKIT
jgi:hypothetical protein